MTTDVHLIEYVQEELDNIRTALLESGLPYLVATEALLRPAAVKLVTWLRAVEADGQAIDREDLDTLDSMQDVPF